MSTLQTTRNRALSIGWIGLIATAITTVTLMVYAMKPWTEDYASLAYGAVFGFSIWAITPHAGLAVILLLFRRTQKLAIAGAALANLIAFGGLAIIIDVLFIHLDAQGGIALIFIPLYQWVAATVVAILGAIGFGLARSSASSA